MVDRSTPSPSNIEKPFAIRSTVYTLVFLIFILGLVPGVARFLGERLWPDSQESRSVVLQYWIAFVELAGIALFAIGLAAYLACSAWLIYFGRGPHVEFDPPKAFVATGPYRWVRNPVVITLLVTLLGEAVYFQSIGIAALLVVGFPIAHFQVTRIEEPRLRKRFGQSYADYCARVRRWLPRPPSDGSSPPGG